jgi:hypothetical protein
MFPCPSARALSIVSVPAHLLDALLCHRVNRLRAGLALPTRLCNQILEYLKEVRHAVDVSRFRRRNPLRASNWHVAIRPRLAPARRVGPWIAHQSPSADSPTAIMAAHGLDSRLQERDSARARFLRTGVRLSQSAGLRLGRDCKSSVMTGFVFILVITRDGHSRSFAVTSVTSVTSANRDMVKVLDHKSCTGAAVAPLHMRERDCERSTGAQGSCDCSIGRSADSDLCKDCQDLT